jgi:hypothetical protein
LQIQQLGLGLEDDLKTTVEDSSLQEDVNLVDSEATIEL